MAAVNKGARILLLMVSLLTFGAGSVSKVSVRDGCCGGTILGEDFVLGSRRRGDAGSGGVVRSWSFFRSATPAVVQTTRRLLLGSSARAVCWWRIWRGCGSRRWVRRRSRPRHVRSSVKVPLLAAGSSWLQPWRFLLVQRKVSWWFRSVLQRVAAVSVFIFALFAVWVLRQLYFALC